MNAPLPAPLPLPADAPLEHALFDVQWLTPHLASLGAVEIPRSEYLTRLASAVSRPVDPFS